MQIKSKFCLFVTNSIDYILLQYHILFDNQYSFRQNHSTYMALLETIDRVSDALDKKRTTVGVFIDLSKAFDTVDHTILLNKLDYYGIKGLALEWFKNYLSD